MEFLEILWNLDITDRTKYLSIIGMIGVVFLICILSSKKKNKRQKIKKNIAQHNDKFYMEYSKLYSPSNCQRDYVNCVNNNNDRCYPCLTNGAYPDFFYDARLGQWIKTKR